MHKHGLLPLKVAGNPFPVVGAMPLPQLREQSGLLMSSVITQLVHNQVPHNWILIAGLVERRHTHLSCRQRWVNLLNPGVNRKHFSEREDAVSVRGI